MSAPTNHTAAMAATIKDAFGEVPADVLLERRIAADTLEDIETLFASIKGALEADDAQLLSTGAVRGAACILGLCADALKEPDEPERGADDE